MGKKNRGVFTRVAFADVVQNRCSKKFGNFYKKTPVLELLFKNVAPLLKRDSNTGVFLLRICQISNTFYGTPLAVVASVFIK